MPVGDKQKLKAAPEHRGVWASRVVIHMQWFEVRCRDSLFLLCTWIPPLSSGFVGLLLPLTPNNCHCQATYLFSKPFIYLFIKLVLRRHSAFVCHRWTPLSLPTSSGLYDVPRQSGSHPGETQVSAHYRLSAFFSRGKKVKNMDNPPRLCARNVLKIGQYIKQNKYIQKVWKLTIFQSLKGTILTVSRAPKSSDNSWPWGCLTLGKSGELHGIKRGAAIAGKHKFPGF